MAGTAKRVAWGVGAALAAATVTQWFRVRDGYPWFNDLDPSGEWGDPALPRVEMVLLGDSSCTGNGLHGPDEIWVQQLAPRLSTSCRLLVRNHAVGGVKIQHVIDEQLPRAVAEPGDIAVVSVGGNDALRFASAPAMERKMDTIVTQLVDAGYRVVLSGIGDLGTSPRAVHPFQHYLTWRSMVTDKVHERVAARHPGVRKVAMWDTTPEFRDRKDVWAPDLFHPNRHGHSIWAEACYPDLQAAIDEVILERIAG